jgi:hypothetical protein
MGQTQKISGPIKSSGHAELAAWGQQATNLKAAKGPANSRNGGRRPTRLPRKKITLTSLIEERVQHTGRTVLIFRRQGADIGKRFSELLGRRQFAPSCTAQRAKVRCRHLGHLHWLVRKKLRTLWPRVGTAARRSAARTWRRAWSCRLACRLQFTGADIQHPSS